MKDLWVTAFDAGDSPSDQGNVCHAAFWDDELTSTHVSEVYNNGTPPDLNNLLTAPTPSGWLPMDARDSLDAMTDYGSIGANATVANSDVGDIITDSPFEITS